MDALEATPELTAAFRFVIWALALATAIVAVHYARRTSGERVPPAPLWGIAIEAVGWFGHQFYYWLWWRAKAHGNTDLLQALSEIRHITSFFLLFVVVGVILIVSPFLKSRFGSAWPAVAVASVAGLWLIGWGDASWQ